MTRRGNDSDKWKVLSTWVVNSAQVILEYSSVLVTALISMTDMYIITYGCVFIWWLWCLWSRAVPWCVTVVVYLHGVRLFSCEWYTLEVFRGVHPRGEWRMLRYWNFFLGGGWSLGVECCNAMASRPWSKSLQHWHAAITQQKGSVVLSDDHAHLFTVWHVAHTFTWI